MGEDGVGKEFEECIEKGKLRKFPAGDRLFAKELKSAEEDLVEAKGSYQNKKFKWATIQGYYSMFHTARALVYSQGFREKSHYCLIMALKELFVNKKLLSPKIAEMLQHGKTLSTANGLKLELEN
jgi:uncharacterized protein (UPF0332 family)